MKQREQSNVKYKEFGIQRETSEETSGLICQPIFYWESNIYQ